MSRAAVLSCWVILSFLPACVSTRHGPVSSSPEPLYHAESYLQSGDFKLAYEAANHQLDTARHRNNIHSAMDANLLIGEALVGLKEFLTARGYLVEVKNRGDVAQREGAKALLAWSYDEQDNRVLARSYFTEVRRNRVDPDLWNRIIQKLSPEVIGKPVGPGRTRALSPRTHLASVKILPRSRWTRQGVRTHLANPMETIRKITIHHTAIMTHSQSMSEVAAHLRSIQRNHFSRGWADVGYHYFIDHDGRIWEGRPARYQGAHAGNHQLNRGNLGISLLGDFNVQRVPWAQKTAMKNLIAYLVRKHRVSLKQVYGHGKVRATECPGKYVNLVLPGILAELAARPSGGGRVHRVVRGDTLMRIARRYGVSLGVLKQLNPGRGDVLHAGEVIAVP